MATLTKHSVQAVATLLILLAVVLAVTVVLLNPPTGDLVVLALFLFLSGGITVGLGVAVAQFGLPSWARSIRSRLIIISALVTVLSLANVGFVAVLMFFSQHDLYLLAGLMVFSVGMAIFVAYASSEPTARVMGGFVSAVREINTGSLDTRVPVESNDEVGELAAAFNDMVERLQSSFERERDLENARKDLFGAVSHDLRTPLASIRAMIESINDGVVTDEDTKARYLATIQSEVENLSGLIGDLFELSQIDAGILALHIESSSIQDLISDTLESMAAQANNRRLRLEGEVDEDISPSRWTPSASSGCSTTSCRTLSATPRRTAPSPYAPSTPGRKSTCRWPTRERASGNATCPRSSTVPTEPTPHGTATPVARASASASQRASSRRTEAASGSRANPDEAASSASPSRSPRRRLAKDPTRPRTPRSPGLRLPRTA